MPRIHEKKTFFVSGMHCNACVVLTESELRDAPSVVSAKTDLKAKKVEVEGDFKNQSDEEIAANLSKKLEKHGYRLSTTRQPEQKIMQTKEYAKAAAVAAGILAGMYLLQKAGISNLFAPSAVSFGGAFIIGIVASLSTCMAVVGGLTLALSATYAKQAAPALTHVLFHAGRIAGFFTLGGVVGLLGTSFKVNGMILLALQFIVAVVMLGVGLSLLGLPRWASRLLPSMPRAISSRILSLRNTQHSVGPAALGALTFFLPCGFTQSMQLYALTTGSFITGALVMLSFALGTLPALALVSFGTRKFERGPAKTLFLKSAGFVVVALALQNARGALAAAGIVA